MTDIINSNFRTAVQDLAELQMRANEMHERAMALAQKRLRKLDKEHKRAMRESAERLKNLDHEKAMAESDERLGQLDEERESDLDPRGSTFFRGSRRPSPSAARIARHT